MRSADSPLAVGPYTVPPGAISWRFGPTGGPGGQHANKAETRVELRFDLAESDAFPPEIREAMLGRLKTIDGTVVIVVDETRSQWRNRVIARRRLAELLTEGLHRPTLRRPTQPSQAARRRRLRTKRQRSEIKAQRQRPGADPEA